MSAGKHVAVWPKVRVSVKGKSKIVARGDLLPEGVSQVDLDNLVSFGAIAGATLAPATPENAEDNGPKPGTAEYILAEVGDDPTKAKAALDAEVADKGDKARKTLVKDLEAVIAKGGQGS